ncbi:RHS repeat-associated core domain-containing protein [Streptomyces sp. NPDC046985]|uniref:RHS repeat-associated core domain-containing protein n=1 Tax=Streptomyces sp. NPDC046985 TaxID=3155377 RepID=UPI003400D48D
MTRGGNPYCYVADDKGAPSVLVDDTGAKQDRWEYDPIGSARSTNTAPVDQPFGYAGAYRGPTGLYKTGARYDGPTLGRFTQTDPSGKESNAYAYATGDPVNRLDSTGLSNSGAEYALFGLAAVSVLTGGISAHLPIGLEASTAAEIFGGISLTTGIAGLAGAGACLFSDADGC